MTDYPDDRAKAVRDYWQRRMEISSEISALTEQRRRREINADEADTKLEALIIESAEFDELARQLAKLGIDMSVNPLLGPASKTPQ